MNLSNIQELKNYFRARGLKPKDYMGQNFLVDEDVLEEIVAVADLKPTDVVLEVGPGLGVLTRKLTEKAGQVWAIEKDAKLIPFLKTEMRGTDNLEIVNEDILRFHVAGKIKGDYKVVANIPYYLTSKLIQIFLESDNQPKVLVLMIQKEVGERIVAAAGELSVLGISVQIYADAEVMANVSKDSFWPVPKVDSVILKITPKNKYPEIMDKKLFFRIIKMAFAGKRKQIQNSLANGFKLPKENILQYLTQAQIDSKMRPQDLAIGDWIQLYQVIGQAKV